MTTTFRIDSHQHFWWLARGDYHWLDGAPSDLNQNFLPENLQPLLTQTGVNQTIIVQAAETLAETHFLLDIANQYEFVAGVVGWVDMNLSESLSALETFSEHPKFLGIRPFIQSIPDIDWMLKPELDAIFRWLIDHDRSFDALVKPIHLDNLSILLTRYPELRVVINHGAKPNIADADFYSWAEKIQKIAQESNAFCKLSGLVTEAGNKITDEKLHPYMTHLMQSFGAHRLMWGSDWPVCTLAINYQQWIECTERFLKPYSTEEQEAIWYGSAQRFYKVF